MKEKIKNLYNEDNNSAYKTLLELETITTESNELYNYFNEFLKMLNNEKTFIRVRGFRLICSLAKWDNENKINKNIDHNIFKSVDNVNLNCILGTTKNGEKHSFLEEYGKE